MSSISSVAIETQIKTKVVRVPNPFILKSFTNNVNCNHVMLIRLIFHIYHSELPVKITDHHLHGDLLSFEKSR